MDENGKGRVLLTIPPDGSPRLTLSHLAEAISPLLPKFGTQLLELAQILPIRAFFGRCCGRWMGLAPNPGL